MGATAIVCLSVKVLVSLPPSKTVAENSSQVFKDYTDSKTTKETELDSDTTPEISLELRADRLGTETVRPTQDSAFVRVDLAVIATIAATESLESAEVATTSETVNADLDQRTEKEVLFAKRETAT